MRGHDEDRGAANRPSHVLAIYAGVDVGGTKTEAVLTDATGTALARSRIATRPGREGVVSSVIGAVHAAAAGAGIVELRLNGVGVGVPGAVDVSTGHVSRAVNLAVSDLPLAAAVGAALHCPVRVDNDVNLAALGAAHSLGLPPDASLAFLNLGTGMGAGIAIEGRTLRGLTGAAGEIGHLPFDPLGPLCACGLRGCLEVYASGSGLLRASGGRPLDDLFAAAVRGDDEESAIVDRFSAALAIAIRVLVQTTDVDVIVLGGGVFTSKDAFLPRVLAELEATAVASPFIRTLGIADRIVVADPGAPLAATGAAIWAATSTPHDTAQQPEGAPRG